MSDILANAPISAQPAALENQRVVIAGTAGGVGTTTVTALLFTAMSSGGVTPQLFDRSGGELGIRLTAGDEAREVDLSVTLHDFGPNAFDAALDELERPDTIVLLVTAATPAGLASAERFLTAVRSRYSAGGIRRVLVAAVGVFGSHRVGSLVEKLHESFGHRTIVVIPRDVALAVGGRIPQNRLSAETRRAQTELASLLKGRLATH
jgi:MinD-like ATPase involved in chromosome partitioning or flagellar assembly